MALSADVRRVITTIDRNDRAVVLFDGATPHKKVRPQSQTVSRLLWVTDQTPADVTGSKDRAAIDIGIMPPRGGSVFRVVDFPPETAEMRNLDPNTLHASLGDGACAAVTVNLGHGPGLRSHPLGHQARDPGEDHPVVGSHDPPGHDSSDAQPPLPQGGRTGV